MIQHNFFCFFRQNIINKKESFELTHMGGVDERGCRRSYGGYIGLVSKVYTKTPHRDITQMDRNILTILLHENCGWIIT